MFQARIKLLQSELSHHEIDGLLITSVYNISYLSGIINFSIEEREARILITKQDIYLFTDPRYSELVKQNAPFVTLSEISSEKPFLKLLKHLIKAEKIKSLGFEEDSITYKEAADLEEELKDIQLIPTVEIVEKQREIKDNNEIEKVKLACELTDKAFDYILKHLKPEVTEIEIKTLLENFIRNNGGEPAFPSIIAFGKNSAIPHHLSSNSQLLSPGIVLLDFGAKVEGYCSDMTRTVFIGESNEKLKQMYKATLEAQELAIDYLKTHAKEGFETKKAHILANSHLKALGFDPIPHSLGHGVGLQVHEEPKVSPYSKGGLIPGMVITVEPGVYKPNFGGIRIEDTILITTDGIELLTKSPKELIMLDLPKGRFFIA